MIWLISGFIIAVIVIICGCIFFEWDSIGEKIANSVLTLITSFAISVLVAIFINIIITPFSEIEYSVISDTKIIALKDNQNISGSFYLLGGYADEDLYYYYAIETEFGYTTEKIKAENVYIKYTNDEPHIEEHQGSFANKKNNLWAFPLCSNKYIIYCPNGTVTHEFNIDLE